MNEDARRSHFDCGLKKSIPLLNLARPVVWMMVGTLLLYGYYFLRGYDVQHGSFKSMDEIYRNYRYLEGFHHYYNYARA